MRANTLASCRFRPHEKETEVGDHEERWYVSSFIFEVFVVFPFHLRHSVTGVIPPTPACLNGLVRVENALRSEGHDVVDL